MKIKIFLFVLFIATVQSLYAQIDSAQTVNKKRLRTFVIASSAAYAITLVGLNELWYKNAEQEDFHFFNDNSEWLQVDKLGHFYSSYYFSYTTSKGLLWCGLPDRKAALWGALTGFFIMLPIEIMDGYSSAYGASSGDLLANTAGAGFFLAQSLLWNEQRIRPKFSYHQTDFASVRPNVLGDDFTNSLFKDYNGQTYWLSFDLDKFMRFPKWLNLAVGYGATGMVYARSGPNREAGYDAMRQYYVGIDFDVSSIKTHSKALKTILFFVDMIKLPAPTIEFSSKGTRFHAFYF